MCVMVSVCYRSVGVFYIGVYGVLREPTVKRVLKAFALRRTSHTCTNKQVEKRGKCWLEWKRVWVVGLHHVSPISHTQTHLFYTTKRIRTPTLTRIRT